MGFVMTKIKLWNGTDEDNARKGLLRPEEVRTEILDGLVDTGAIMLALPEDVVARLGLPEIDRRPVRVADGRRVILPIAGGLRMEILGRSTTCDAYVLPAGATPLIGVIPLEALDLVVDPSSGEARTNPAHPDGPEYLLLAAG